jgi:hypothetical protein
MRVESEIVIERPPKVVWSWIDDSKKTPLWMKGLIDDVAITPPPTRVGSQFRMRIREGFKTAEYVREITAYEPERSLSVRFCGGPYERMAMQSHFRLEDLGGRTRLRFAMGCEPQGGMIKLLAPLFALFARAQSKRFGRKLKELAESEAA